MMVYVLIAVASSARSSRVSRMWTNWCRIDNGEAKRTLPLAGELPSLKILETNLRYAVLHCYSSVV